MPRSASSGVLPPRPALVPWCRLIEDRGRVLVEHAGTLVTLEGGAAQALLPRLLPLLDGTRTAEDLGAILGRTVEPAIENALRLLAEHDLLVDGPGTDGSPAGTTASYTAMVTRTTSPAAAALSLERARVSVVGSGTIALELVRQLRGAGIEGIATVPIDADPDPGSFVVAAPEHAELHALRRLNQRALECGDPWLQVLPYDGRFLVAGPVFVPGTSACHACFVARRAATSGFDEDFDLVESVARRTPHPSPLVAIAAALATVVVAGWLTTADPILPGRFYALEAGPVVRLRFDRLLRVPRCPACGPHAQAAPSPWFEAPS